MPLLSAIADFTERSLGSLQTTWEKLAFLADLREADGAYRQWGLEGVHGAEETTSALARAHGELMEALASSRLSELWQEAGETAHREETDPVSVIARASSANAQAADMHGVAPEHFEFVVTNLWRVARYRSQSNRQAA